MADLRADRDATPTDWTPPTQPIVDNSIDSAPIAQNALASPYRPTVAEAEWRLSELGYTPGPIDGLLDAETRDALRAYQRDSALAPSGRMTRDTLNNMRRDTRLPGPAAFSDWEGVQ
jgi:peptidoglycan hydrolase-like protein with peptidoglycan-binding domain